MSNDKVDANYINLEDKVNAIKFKKFTKLIKKDVKSIIYTKINNSYLKCAKSYN